MSRESGFAKEQQARNYLTRQGLRWLSGNYSCRWGEIDLIMQDQEHLVFVEVRSRVSEEYGGALESVTPQKIKKIIKTASHYLSTKNKYHTEAVRFDVVCLQGYPSRIEWIKNAFQADSW